MKSNLLQTTPNIHFLLPPAWPDYELIDSGNGSKLERYGPYVLNRPEPEAIWKPALPQEAWMKADAKYIPGKGEESGQWQFQKEIPRKWHITFRELRISLQFSSSRHIGVFPEQAVQWDWIQQQIRTSKIQPKKVLNLFGYSGMATLAAASAGAQVTHIDASPKAIQWARENQELSGLSNRPIRWIVDDALKYVQREKRRGNHYEGIILDPPKFGRGPKGEVWEFYKMLPALLDACMAVLSSKPLFVVITAYAIKASSLTLLEVVKEMMHGLSGNTIVGELLLQEKHAGRYLSKAIYALWSNQSS
jgi:23S rRNA (cytosine1962-C5)-methyltransferase